MWWTFRFGMIWVTQVSVKEIISIGYENHHQSGNLCYLILRTFYITIHLFRTNINILKYKLCITDAIHEIRTIVCFPRTHYYYPWGCGNHLIPEVIECPDQGMPITGFAVSDSGFMNPIGPNWILDKTVCTSLTAHVDVITEVARCKQPSTNSSLNEYSKTPWNCSACFMHVIYF